MNSQEEKSANQFISALVKNLQAVCHGNVEFDKNVKVVGHLFLTVDSATEFNYIVNEKVSKSDESSTTFISKSFYATDPQQKTPKKNLDRPLPPPTPNVLGKTRYDISVDLTDEPGGGRPTMHQRGQFSRPQGYPGSLNRNPQMRRRPFDQNRLPPHQMAKMPRLSSPQRQSMNLSPLSPRKISTLPSQRLNAPSTITSPSIPIPLDPASVSATPAHSLPGADKPESDSTSNTSDTTDKPDIKFEVIKVENGSVVASNKDKSEGDDGQLKIESVTSHDLSIDTASTGEKDSEGDSSLTVKPFIPSDLQSDSVSGESKPQDLKTDNDDDTEDDVTAIETPPVEEPEVIEIDIDLTKVKDEDDNSNTNSCLFSSPSSGFQIQPYSGAQGGDNSLSSFGIDSNDEDFFNSLHEQTSGLYPVSFHANDSGNQSFTDAGLNQNTAYLPGAGPSSNQSATAAQGNKQDKTVCCNICGVGFSKKGNLKRHMEGIHLNMRIKCPCCPKTFTQKSNLKGHIIMAHKEFIGN